MNDVRNPALLPTKDDLRLLIRHGLRWGKAPLRLLKHRVSSILRPEAQKPDDVMERLSHEIAAIYAERADRLSADIRQGLKPGIGIYGFFTAEIGLGQAARRLAQAIQAGGVPHSLHNIAIPQLFESRIETTASDERTSSFDTILLHLNPDPLMNVLQDMPQAALLGRRRIACWLWELPVLPMAWGPALDSVHEVWAPSRFVASTVAAATSKPVRVVPYPIPTPDIPQNEARAQLNLSPEPYFFLTIFDLNSRLARKNPLANIKAFQDAFPRRNGIGPVSMIVKCHGRTRGPEFDDLARLASSDDRLMLIDRVMSPEEMTILQAACDCYVSLHRAEGFGFNVAECMALGKTVITTDFSSTTDFATSRNSLPIPYKMKAVGDGEYVHGAGQWWADPDHDAAVAAMRLAASRSSEVRALGRQARIDIERLFSLERTGQIARAAWLGELPPFTS